MPNRHPLLSRQKKFVLVAVIATAWIVPSGQLLYTIETREQRIFDPRILAAQDPFSSLAVEHQFTQLAPDLETTTVFYPWDPNCDCTSAAVEHIRNLAATLKAHNAQVVIVSQPEHRLAAERLAGELRAVDNMRITVASSKGLDELIPASPAAAVLSADQRLIYFGPWSAGAACVAGTRGFVESALRALSEPNPATVVNRTAMGCYCPWTEREIERH